MMSSDTTSDTAQRAVCRRYEGLLTVKTKAIRGKGAWYWAHLDPILLHEDDSGIAKSVKLRCSLCESVFSASNPSRTASEHLKRGTCPNFSTSPSAAIPINSISPNSCHNKRQHLVLSGGKDDVTALALLENSVKKLKSPQEMSPPPMLTRQQIEAAVSLLSDWVYESAGSVSLSAMDTPKFHAFLRCVGLPAFSPGAGLDARYENARADVDARMRDAMFFQVSASGWKSESGVVSISINLPNGSAVFNRAVLAGANAASSYAEDVLGNVVNELGPQRCAGIVADRFKSKALRELEARNYWMVNLSCQIQGFKSLLEDFVRDLPLFRVVADHSYKVANFFNGDTRARNVFHRQLVREFGYACILKVAPEIPMIEDIFACARSLQLAAEDINAGEFGEMIRNVQFWTNLDAVHSFVNLVKDIINEMEFERPLVGRCLAIWEEFRWKIEIWCKKFGIDEESVEKIINARFAKNYHPAWSAAFVLDPLHLKEDSTGKYLPPFRNLTPEQEKDVDKLITRLVSRDEAHIALMELMKWRSEGLDPLYARAVQVKEMDPDTGKMRVVNPQSSRLVWETVLSSEFKTLAKVAVRIIFLHATACAVKFSPQLLRGVVENARSRRGMERAQKLMFVAAHAKLERRDTGSDEDDGFNEKFSV